MFDRAVDLHAGWIINLDSQPIRCGKLTYQPSTLTEIQARLGGKDLGCYCDPGQPYHATLLELASAPAEVESKARA